MIIYLQFLISLKKIEFLSIYREKKEFLVNTLLLYSAETITPQAFH